MEPMSICGLLNSESKHLLLCSFNLNNSQVSLTYLKGSLALMLHVNFNLVTLLPKFKLMTSLTFCWNYNSILHTLCSVSLSILQIYLPQNHQNFTHHCTLHQHRRFGIMDHYQEPLYFVDEGNSTKVRGYCNYVIMYNHKYQFCKF